MNSLAQRQRVRLQEGIVDYKQLPLAGATEFWDDAAQATYSYDPQKRVLSSYDSLDSVRVKCQYVHEKGLAGIIVWESSADFPVSHPRSLTAALAAGLKIEGGNINCVVPEVQQQTVVPTIPPHLESQQQPPQAPGQIASWLLNQQTPPSQDKHTNSQKASWL
ncbi:UNVERIFIED_CONTAM: hypothetical protein HDU68_005242 [Siphonaria sp. JEL0065]|nr:hypothetical protein HDU68_005242 [Siphonaria sp. JEL0065]